MRSQFSNKQDLREQQRSCKAAFRYLTTSNQTTLSRENWEIATISLQLQLWPSSLREYKAALSQPSLIKKASIGSDYTTMEFWEKYVLMTISLTMEKDLTFQETMSRMKYGFNFLRKHGQRCVARMQRLLEGRSLSLSELWQELLLLSLITKNWALMIFGKRFSLLIKLTSQCVVLVLTDKMDWWVLTLILWLDALNTKVIN